MVEGNYTKGVVAPAMCHFRLLQPNIKCFYCKKYYGKSNFVLEQS